MERKREVVVDQAFDTSPLVQHYPLSSSGPTTRRRALITFPSVPSTSSQSANLSTDLHDPTLPSLSSPCRDVTNDDRTACQVDVVRVHRGFADPMLHA